jgi:hypothetical protein
MKLRKPLKKQYEIDVRKPLRVSIYKVVKSCDFGLEFDSFKPLLKSGIFKCISLLNGSFFGLMIRVF